jgi:4-aminobutyrate aminotransferase-like enzyme
MPWIHKAINPDLYRGPYTYEDANAGGKYAMDVKNIIDTLAKENKKPAAYICETLLGVGGQMPLPPNYLKEVYKHVRAAGGICIADEVQVGFGRVGSHFWGFELQDVVPDMVVMGKPIGNGHPLAAVIVTDAIANSFNNGIEYFNTYGGNPVSMATGLAVLDVIEREGLQENALQVGNYLLEGMRALMHTHSIIGDVRGSGLFIGVELVKDRLTKEPATEAIKLIVEKMKDKGFLMGVDGPYNNVFKIKPPIIFSMENAKDLLTNLDTVLASL